MSMLLAAAFARVSVPFNDCERSAAVLGRLRELFGRVPVIRPDPAPRGRPGANFVGRIGWLPLAGAVAPLLVIRPPRGDILVCKLSQLDEVSGEEAGREIGAPRLGDKFG